MPITAEAKQKLTESIKKIMGELTEEERETALIVQAQFLESYHSMKKAIELFAKGNPDKKVRLIFEFDSTEPSMTLDKIKVI